MGDATKDFSRWEFACRCGCGLQDPHPLLVVAMQRYRDLIGAKVDITSGCRCPVHNLEVGGAPKSKHVQQESAAEYCLAADHTTAGKSLMQMFNTALLVAVFRRGGIGVYFDENGARIHTDVRRDGPTRFGILFGEKVTPSLVIREATIKGL